MALTVANATTSDIPELVGLLNLLFSIEGDFAPNEAAQARGLALLMAQPERAPVFVARDGDGKAVAMVSAQLVISTAMGAPSAWIEDMVVAEAWRGNGLGKSLLEKAKEWALAKGAARLQLLADVDNAPALGFYRRLEWQATRLFAWKKVVG